MNIIVVFSCVSDTYVSILVNIDAIVIALLIAFCKATFLCLYKSPVLNMASTMYYTKPV